MANRDWRNAEEDWSQTGSGCDSADDGDDDLEGDALDGDDTLPCPQCGAEIYADLDHCPRCGHWLSDADRSAHETGLFASRWVRLIAVALLAIFVLSLLAELALFG